MKRFFTLLTVVFLLFSQVDLAFGQCDTALIVTTSVTHATCFGTGNGSLTLTVTGGTAPYMLSYPNGQSNIPNSGGFITLNNLLAGNYSVSVTDATGCSKVVGPFLINQPNVIVIPTSSIFVTQVTCSGGNDGAISISPTGGILPYSYNWSGPSGFTSNTQFLTGLNAGLYNVTVVDVNGCTGALSSPIQVNQSISLNIQTNITNVACFGGNNGKVILNPSSYFYNWSDGVPGGTRNNLSAGTYEVTATEISGCTSIVSVNITQPSEITIETSVTNATCFGGNDGSVQLLVTGGTSPYNISWSGGFPGNNLNNLSAGAYIVTVTDVNGCLGTTPFIIGQSPPPSISSNIEVTPITCLGESNGAILFSLPPIFTVQTYNWSGPNNFSANTSSITNLEAGIYNLTYTYNNGCTQILSPPVEVPISPNAIECNKIIGKINQDLNDNCLYDPNEPNLAHWIIKAVKTNTNEVFYSMSDDNGQYTMAVPDGSYEVSLVPPSSFWLVCGNPVSANITPQMDSINIDFFANVDFLCPKLTVDLSIPVLRRCFDNNKYHVQYCNYGTETAQNAYIILTLDDLLSLEATQIPYTDLGNNQYRFELGNVAIGQCGNFWARVKVSCDAILGQSHCSEAQIYPDSLCQQFDPLWSGANVDLDAICVGDSLQFIIKNTGYAPMTDALEYIVIEDGVMLRMESAPPLNPNATMIVNVPANGSTWRIEANQENYHPLANNPSVSVEGCSVTGSFTTGYIAQFPQDDAALYLDIDCTANVGSYDPNDKSGFPIGFGQEHFIRPNTDIEYLIRFQNTGTDTAFTVVVRDTLSQWLDPASIRAGASSHAYQLDLTGQGIMTFRFENILLPDSNTNEVASHGFLKYRISQKASVPLETKITNRAGIFFDYNEPVMTNTTEHRVSENFLTLANWQPAKPTHKVQISPNPMHDLAVIEVIGVDKSWDLDLKVFDQFGTLQHQMSGFGGRFTLQKADLAAGIYFFKVEKEGVVLGVGKLVVF
jgi:uncharacterized repeat protein (TIGR01451 family)